MVREVVSLALPSGALLVIIRDMIANESDRAAVVETRRARFKRFDGMSVALGVALVGSERERVVGEETCVNEEMLVRMERRFARVAATSTEAAFCVLIEKDFADARSVDALTGVTTVRLVRRFMLSAGAVVAVIERLLRSNAVATTAEDCGMSLPTRLKNDLAAAAIPRRTGAVLIVKLSAGAVAARHDTGVTTGAAILGGSASGDPPRGLKPTI
jgi:hypothetical protein